MSKTIEQKVADFWNGYAGRELAAKLSKKVYNYRETWHIRGEDPNADFGGNHHMPHIAYVVGNINDIVKLAVQHKDFYQWGSGGDFNPIAVQTLAEFADRLSDKARIMELEQQLKELKAKRK